MSSEESTVHTLTRRAFKLCSHQHLEDELHHLENTFLLNGYTLQKVHDLMQNTFKHLKNTRQPQPLKPINHNLLASFLYDNSYALSIKKALAKYNIGTTFQSNHNPSPYLLTTRHPHLHICSKTPSIKYHVMIVKHST